MHPSLISRLAKRALGYLPFLACIAALAASASLSEFALRNLAVQFLLFLFAASIPALLTGKMAFVDVAWPWGLTAIGAQALIWGDGWAPRQLLIAAMYLVAGLRMAIPGLQLYKPGLLKKDFPRYQYQRLRWHQAGFRNETLSIQYEVGLQALFNASLLALPALLQASNTEPRFAALEIVGVLLWALALGLEFVADRQKLRFMHRARSEHAKTRNCDIGLWRFSRHPNYFFEWMVWNALVLGSIPSLLALAHSESTAMQLLLGCCLLAVSPFMYWVLVHYTGAVPAEHFSLMKRPAYSAYQRSTNRFFPGRPRPLRSSNLPSVAPPDSILS